jgi:hypothetical protein
MGYDVLGLWRFCSSLNTLISYQDSVMMMMTANEDFLTPKFPLLLRVGVAVGFFFFSTGA